MLKPGTSRMVVFKGTKGRQIFEQIANAKPIKVDHAQKAMELRKKLETQGVKFD